MSSRKRAALVAPILAALLAACGGSGESAGPEAAAPPEDVLKALVDRAGAGTAILDCADLASPVAGAKPATGPKGRALPDLSLDCLGPGGALSLATLRGPMVLNVWASWCLPCKDELPYLAAAQQAAGDQVRFAAIALADQAEDSRTWLSFHGVEWPSLEDPDGKVRGPLRIPGPPVTLFVRSDGTIAETHYGAFTSARQVQDAIAEHLGVVT